MLRKFKFCMLKKLKYCAEKWKLCMPKMKNLHSTSSNTKRCNGTPKQLGHPEFCARKWKFCTRKMKIFPIGHRKFIKIKFATLVLKRNIRVLFRGLLWSWWFWFAAFCKCDTYMYMYYKHAKYIKYVWCVLGICYVPHQCSSYLLVGIIYQCDYPVVWWIVVSDIFWLRYCGILY